MIGIETLSDWAATLLVNRAQQTMAIEVRPNFFINFPFEKQRELDPGKLQSQLRTIQFFARLKTAPGAHRLVQRTILFARRTHNCLMAALIFFNSSVIVSNRRSKSGLRRNSRDAE
jgi:hypothetical protein